MTIAEENWSVMASLFPEGWQEMALQFFFVSVWATHLFEEKRVW
jgi:hypothetical protein